MLVPTSSNTSMQMLSCGATASASRGGSCGRAVLESVLTSEEVAKAVAIMEQSFQGVPHMGIEVSVVPDVGAHLSSSDAAFVHEVVERCRQATEWSLSTGPLVVSGTLLKRLELPMKTEMQADPRHDPYVAHADGVNVAVYEYSALLYLSTAGVNFGGGEFAFHDLDMDRLVAPSSGRLVVFTAGLENLHSAVPMSWGSRHFIGMWFRVSSNGQTDGSVRAVELALPVVALTASAVLFFEMARGASRFMRFLGARCSQQKSKLSVRG